tara:strand:+ start:2513 stop:3796 length:1284 start_codon:yes stop_codon:yes gene_type:complete
MTVNKGLSSLVNSNPDFSNQAVENAINDIKAVDKDDGFQFIKSQFDLDTAIHNNAVLTQTQKNDALETLNNAQPHLQIGRYLQDVVRHTNSILDGSIIPGDPAITGTVDNGQGTFLEILSSVQSLQTLIPSLYGVPAKDKARSVNDHLGILNNKLSETEDSSAPVFTRLKRIMQLIDTNARVTTALATATAAVRFSNTELITFLTTIVADSTDFQQSLDNRVNTAAGNMANLNTRISEIAGDPTTDLVAIREEINVQLQLEKSNVSGIRGYLNSVSDYQSYVGLADDEELRKLMARVSQNTNWITYFTDYVSNQAQLNPLYTGATDSDKSAIIDQVLRDSGLPDVVDHFDIEAVAGKAKRDDRIDTKGFDRLTTSDQIISSCRQLSIDVSNNNIYQLSQRLLNNLNQNDRDKIQKALDLNESSSTLS